MPLRSGPKQPSYILKDILMPEPARVFTQFPPAFYIMLKMLNAGFKLVPHLTSLTSTSQSCRCGSLAEIASMETRLIISV